MLVYLISGLGYFSLGLAALLESRHSSKLRIGGQLPFLAAFGICQGILEWTHLLIFIYQDAQLDQYWQIATAILLPLSTLFLAGFGVRVLLEAGSLPRWILYAPPVLFVPVGLVLGYALVQFRSEPSFQTYVEVWARYLLYFPGSLVAALGFLRQRQTLDQKAWNYTRRLLLLAAMAFILNAFIGGLIVPEVNYGLASFLNSQTVYSVTGLPVEFWRMISALVLTIFVIQSLSVFEEERKFEIVELDQKHTQAIQSALLAEAEARHLAENWTKALVGISREIVEMVNVDETLIEIVRTARTLLHSDTASLGLWDETHGHLLLKYYSTPQETGWQRQMEVEDPRVLEPLREGCVALYPDEKESKPTSIHCPILNQDLKAVAITPLRLDEQFVGGLWVGRLDANPFSPGELTGLKRLADQAVIALTHTLMAARLQSLAVMEERNRIAREMHDGLSQILGYTNLEMQTIEILLRQGEYEKAAANIKQTRQNIKQANEEVRDNILSLRTTLSGEIGVIPALQEYLDEFHIQTGLTVQFDCEKCQEINLSPMAETQMVRIIQEALTNVRKHSQAKTVFVRLEGDTNYTYVSISDDGVGFEPTEMRGHFGLEMMDERAASVGGKLSISAIPGGGSHVELWLPGMQMRPAILGEFYVSN